MPTDNSRDFRALGLISRTSLVSAATGSIKRAGKQVRKLVKPKPQPKPVPSSSSKIRPSLSTKAFGWLTSRFKKPAAVPEPHDIPIAIKQPSERRRTIYEDTSAVPDHSSSLSSGLSQLSVYFPHVTPSQSIDSLETPSEDETPSEEMQALDFFRIFSSIQVKPSPLMQGLVQPYSNRSFTRASSQPPFFVPIRQFLAPKFTFSIRRNDERIKRRELLRKAFAPYQIPIRRDQFTFRREPWMTTTHMIPQYPLLRTRQGRADKKSPGLTVEMPIVSHLSRAQGAVVILSMVALPLCQFFFG